MTLVNLARSKASKAKKKRIRRQKAAVKKLTEAEKRTKEQQRIRAEREMRRSLSEKNRREAGMDEPEETNPDRKAPAAKKDLHLSNEPMIDIALPEEPKPKQKAEPEDTARERDTAGRSRTASRVKGKRFGAATATANPNRITVGGAIMFGLLTTVLIGLVIYGRVQTNEAYTEIAKLEAEYNDLVEKNVSMKSEMEGKMTVKNIQEYAENVLGLMPLNQSQIEYIQLQTEDEVTISQPKESFFVRVNDYLTRFWEFLSGE